MNFKSIDDLHAALAAQNYIAERGLSTAIFLALKLGRPLFLEGEAGVGKTEIAKVLAALLDTDLIRLQCYEGLDVSHAVYEWNYTRQMLSMRLAETRGEHASEAQLFGPEFLLKRPLLQAIEEGRTKSPVLLIDELDRSDDECADSLRGNGFREKSRLRGVWKLGDRRGACEPNRKIGDFKNREARSIRELEIRDHEVKG